MRNYRLNKSNAINVIPAQSTQTFGRTSNYN